MGIAARHPSYELVASSFRGDAKHRTRNLEIPGLVITRHPGMTIRHSRNDSLSKTSHNIPDSSSSAFLINSSLTTTLARGTRKNIADAHAIDSAKIAAVSGSVVVEWPPR